MFVFGNIDLCSEELDNELIDYLFDSDSIWDYVIMEKNTDIHISSTAIQRVKNNTGDIGIEGLIELVSDQIREIANK